MSDRLAVGILSAAHVHTDMYATHLAEFPDVEFVGIADTDEERGREAADRHGVEYLSRETLLDRIDAGIICSENGTRPEWFEAAAASGVDVLCEKPLAATYEQAREITATYEASDVVAGLVMPLRFLEIVRETKAAYESGAIGDLRFVTGTNRGMMPGGWFVDPDLAGGGAIMDHTVHILDLVRWITDTEVEEVYAKADTAFHDLPVEDVNVLSMRLEDGTPFTLDGSWSRPDAYETWGDATLELLGTDGVVSIDPHEQAIKKTIDHGDDPGLELVPYRADENRASLRNFLSAVEEGREPLTSLEEGRKEMAMLEAAYESVEREEPVEVRYER